VARVRFRLSTILLLVVVAALVFGLVAEQRRSAAVKASLRAEVARLASRLKQFDGRSYDQAPARARKYREMYR
jgi:hypothetical protein